MILAELQEYLGSNYEPHKLVWTPDAERAALADWRKFEKDKEALYLYARRETHGDWWLPHLAFVRENLGRGDALDVHAATGWAGMTWAAAFADYQTKPLEFLRWRLKQAKDKRPVYDLKGEIPLYPLAVCLDGVWRYERPDEFIEWLAGMGSAVIIALDARQVEAPALMEWIMDEYDLIAYRNVNHYVHLVAFATGTISEGE